MPHYVIEMSHTDRECLATHDMIVRLGMHILHHTWWGCRVGDHTGWLDIELEREQDARGIVPPPLRKRARVVEVLRLTSHHVKALHQ